MRSRKWILVLAAPALLACQSSAGVVKRQASEGPYTVTVFPQGPSTWGYTVATSTQDGIVSVEVVTSADLRQCTLTPETRQLELSAPRPQAQGMVVELRHKEYRQVAVGIRCEDHDNGPVHLVVRNASGIERVLGPVSGPVRRKE